MSKFTFTARNQSGKIVTGDEEAESVDSLVNRLQLRGLLVTNIKLSGQVKAAAQAQVKADKGVRFNHTKIREEDLILLGRQLATALGAGVPLLKSLEVILRQLNSRRLYEIVGNVVKDVSSGFSLRDSLAKYANVFSNLWLNLVETGEASGNLPFVLERLAHYLEVKASFKRKIVSALIYPVILMAVALIAIAVFLMVIVPKFAAIFTEVAVEMPLPTKVMIYLSDFLREKFLFIFIGIVGILIFIRQYRKSRSGKKLFDNLIFKIPIFNDFFILTEIEKFCSSMATLLESGVPILYSLEISERSSGNVYIQDIIKKVKDGVREGKPLVAPLEESSFFPPMVTQMVNMGEEIGELDKMFKKLANYYTEILEIQVTRFTTIFEPMMIVFMGVIIGVMVVSMFLPIFQLANIGST